jgi:8-oxo-dGTP pyrophosphatase MutT (NUDIX family)
MTTSAPPPYLQPVTWDEPSLRRFAPDRLLAGPMEAIEAAGSPSDFDLNPGYPSDRPESLKPAAVLIPILAQPTPVVVLTERMGNLASHAGQIAFPGGKIDQGETALQAALREAQEEIGLDPAFVDPLGFLEPYRTGTGYLVTPLVALIRSGFELEINPREVSSLFEVPLAFLLDSANHRIDSRVWGGIERYYYAVQFGERYIWGATAGIIKALQRRLISQ